MSWPDAYSHHRFTLETARRTKYRILQSKNYNMSRVRRKSPQAHVHTFRVDCRYRPHLSLRIWPHMCESRDTYRCRHALSTMLTATRAAIEYRSVPPGEAAHFVSAKSSSNPNLVEPMSDL